MDLADLKIATAQCSRCELCRGRTKTVLGDGQVPADIMLIGEGPGETEDQQGVPFVGASGQLLRKILKFFGFSSVYITNMVKCRPPNNRNPRPDEIVACRGFLDRQIELIRPKIIVAVGKVAAQALLQTDDSISDIRGSIFRLGSILVVPIFHPAYVLRSPHQLGKMLADLRNVLILERKLP